MKAKYINPFISASMNLFQEYMGIKVTAGKPFVLADPQNLLEVSGIIGLAGETKGAVVLSFSRETALLVVSKFASHEYRLLTNEVLDGVGELINIIAGNAKKDLADFRIEISLPGVITGSNYRMRWPEGIPVISVPMESEYGVFSINISLQDMG